MPASEARIAANRANALKSRGPVTPEGKDASRRNALKHGLTGEGVVLPEALAAEVDRLEAAFTRDFQPADELGRILIRRLALMAARMDRHGEHQGAAWDEHVHQALVDFDEEWPEEEGPPDPIRARMRLHAAKLALFDPSKEACLARKYEAETQRSFYRALNEFRQVRAEAKAAQPAPEPAPTRPPLASFSPEPALARKAAPIAPRPAPIAAPKPFLMPPGGFESFETGPVRRPIHDRPGSLSGLEGRSQARTSAGPRDGGTSRGPRASGFLRR